MEFDLEHYNKSPLQRTLQEVITLGRKKGNTEKYSCEHEPLLRIELDHIVLDELHLTYNGCSNQELSERNS